MKISIFGMGYVGCVAMACLAKHGHDIIGVDINKKKIEMINNGISPIVENNLDNIIKEQHETGKIIATTNGQEAVERSDISFICVGTPSTPNGHLNLSSLFKVCEEIALGIKAKPNFHVVVIRSTVPPGTNKRMTKIIESGSHKKGGIDFAVVSNPEFLREGTAVADFFEPPYTLIGSDCTPAIDLLKKVYENINAPIIVSKIEVAEMIKYVNNSFHALKISFANEIGRICAKIGVDAQELMEIFCLDTKLNISPKYLLPGFAYGGSCLPKDLKALRTMAHDQYVACPVIENIENSNEVQKNVVVQQLLDTGLDHIGFLGLAFKAGTDDLRNSPIVDVIERLLGKGLNLLVYDKHVFLAKLMGANREYIMKKIPYISKFLTDNLEKVIKSSNVIVIVNPEPEFKSINFQELAKTKYIIDLTGQHHINLPVDAESRT